MREVKAVKINSAEFAKYGKFCKTGLLQCKQTGIFLE